MTDQFFSFPWEVQFSLAGGYAAYLLAYTGTRQHHTAVDVFFASVLFGLAVTLTMAVLKPLNAVLAPIMGMLVACGVAIIWRKWLADFVFKVMHKLNLTWSDDSPSALATLMQNRRHPVSQAAVQLDDGTWLYCLDPIQFEGAQGTPFRPITIGPGGDIALYLTHTEGLDNVMKPLTSVRDPKYGDRITYIPANRIRRLTLRHVRKD